MIVVVVFSLLVTAITLLIYSFIFKKRNKSNVFPDSNLSIDIYDFVRKLGQVCPVGPSNDWTLVNTTNGLPCWKKALDYSLIDKKFNVYGATLQISSSAKKILAVIEDVDLWKAWNFTEDSKVFTTRKLCTEGLAYDMNMQYDQIMVDDPLYHRFGNTESNNVSWILIWNVHKFRWTFFLAQPIDDFIIGYSNQEQSLLTIVHCSSIEDIPNFITSSLININQLVSISKLQLRPFCTSSPVLSLCPARSLTSLENNLKNHKTHLLKQRTKCRSVNQLNQTKSSRFIYTLVPFSFSKPVVFNQLCGFLLVPKYDVDSVENDKPVRSKSSKNHSSSSKEFVSRRHRTNSSSSNIFKHEKVLRSMSLLQEPSRHTLQMSDSETIKETPTAVFLKSMLFGQKLYDTDEFKKNCSQDKMDKVGAIEQNNEDNDSQSESSSFEILLPSLNPEDMIKFKTVGAKSVGDFLAELVRASSIDLNSSVEEQLQNTGGWSYDGISGKDVVCLVKRGEFCDLETISYLSKGVIPATVEKVWKAVQNPLTRFTYDETVKKIIVLRKLDHGQKLMHIYHEASTLLKKDARDFCVLQTERIENDRMIVSLQSVEYDNCPLMQGVTRATLLPSGWVVEKLPHDTSGVSCSVSYLAQVVVNLPNSLLLDEFINQQTQCISNLRTYLCPDMC